MSVRVGSRPKRRRPLRTTGVGWSTSLSLSRFLGQSTLIHFATSDSAAPFNEPARINSPFSLSSVIPKLYSLCLLPSSRHPTRLSQSSNDIPARSLIANTIRLYTHTHTPAFAELFPPHVFFFLLPSFSLPCFLFLCFPSLWVQSFLPQVLLSVSFSFVLLFFCVFCFDRPPPPFPPLSLRCFSSLLLLLYRCFFLLFAASAVTTPSVSSIAARFIPSRTWGRVGSLFISSPRASGCPRAAPSSFHRSGSERLR